MQSNTNLAEYVRHTNTELLKIKVHHHITTFSSHGELFVRFFHFTCSSMYFREAKSRFGRYSYKATSKEEEFSTTQTHTNTTTTANPQGSCTAIHKRV